MKLNGSVKTSFNRLKMIIEEASKILGDKYKDVAVNQIKKEIELAELFKDIFFDMLKKRKSLLQVTSLLFT